MTQLRITLIALVLCAAPSVSAKELWERPWIEVRCPHFVIVSALPEKRPSIWRVISSVSERPS